jgi:antitoxin (DNA-binding transcriptional repressor) of toxin-antitoxin stability system
MKRIPAQELATNVDTVLNSAQIERILISRGGKPCAVLVGVEGYDAQDLRLASSQEFWRMIRQRRTRGKSVSLAKVAARFGIAGQEQVVKRAGGKSARKS